MMATKFTPGPWSAIKSAGADHDSIVVTSDGFDPTDVAVFGEQGHANAQLIAAAPDHADIGWAMCVAAGRWEAWGDGRGEFCLNDLRFATKLDPFGIPEVNEPLRAQIAKARGEA